MKGAENLWISRTCSLGDFIVGIPSYKIIKDLNKNHKIFFLSFYNNDLSSIKPSEIHLKYNPIHKFIYFKKIKINNFINFIKFIRKFNFEKLYYLNESRSITKTFRDYLFFKLCNIQKLEGFDFCKLFKLIFNLNKTEKEMHNLISRTNVTITKNKLNKYYFFSLKCKKYYSKKKYITISFGGRSQKKKWSDENWNVLIKYIIKKFPNITIYLVGSSKEGKLANQLLKLYPKNIKNFCFNGDIKNKISIIAESLFHISHDDGSMHIASTFKKKNICIFSRLYPRGLWFPYNPNSIIFWPKNADINSIDYLQVLNKFITNYKKSFNKKKNNYKYYK